MLEAEAKTRQATRATSDYGKNHLVAKIPQGEQSEDEPLPPAPAPPPKPSTQEPTAKVEVKPSPPIEPPKPADTKSRDIAAKYMHVSNSYVAATKTLKAANRVPRFVPPTCADRVPQSDTPPGRNSVNTKE